MKTNPYRFVEYTLIVILCAALVTGLCIVITLAQKWHIVGWVVAIIVGFFMVCAGIDEWNQRKRQWDFARQPKPLEGDVVPMSDNTRRRYYEERLSDSEPKP